MTHTEKPHKEENPTPSGPSSRAKVLVIALVAFLIGLVGFLMLPGSKDSDAPADSYSSAFGGSFSMTDQNGQTVTDQSLRGKPYAIFFGFTRCPDVCPTSLNRMAQLRKRLGSDGNKFNIVFVSVDPEHDKREDIGRYLELFGTPIIGLTGTDAQIAKIVKAFHIYYAKVPIEGGDYTIDHTASIILMDRNGQFISTIDHQEQQGVALEKLKRAIAT
jgi:protein SCO1/2